MDASTSLVLDCLVKSTALLLFAWFVTRLLRRHSSSLRHWVWSLSILGTMALPGLSFCLPQWRLPILPPPELNLASADVASSAREAIQVGAGPIEVGGFVEQAEPTPLGAALAENPPFPSPPEPLPALLLEQGFNPNGMGIPALTWLIPFWLIGLGLSLVPLIRGWFRNLSVVSRATVLSDPHWVRLLETASQSVGVHRRVRLLRADVHGFPVTFGLFRPVILLPVDAGGWGESRARHVLLHELAHIKRWDLAFQTLARLGGSLYWFHPLAWYGLSRLRCESEQACDDIVISTGQHASEYASELVNIAEQYSKPLTSLALGMARQSKLEARLLTLFDRSQSHQPLSPKGVKCWVCGVFCLVVTLVVIHPTERAIAHEETGPSNEYPSGFVRSFHSPSNVDLSQASLTLSHDQESLILSLRGKETLLWTLGSEPRSIKGPTQLGKAVPAGFVGNDGGVFSVPWGYLQLWDSESHEKVGSPLPHALREDTTILPAIRPDGKALVTRSQLDHLQFWNVGTRTPITDEIEHPTMILGLAFSDDGEWLFSKTRSHLRIFDGQTGELIAGPLAHNTFCQPYFPKTRQIATFEKNDKDSASWETQAVIRCYRDRTWAVARRVKLAGHVRQAAWIDENHLVVVGAEQNPPNNRSRLSLVSMESDQTKIQELPTAWWIAGVLVAPDQKHFLTRTYRATTCWRLGKEDPVWTHESSRQGRSHDVSFGEPGWVLLHEKQRPSGESSPVVVRDIATGRELWQSKEAYAAKAMSRNLWICQRDGVERWTCQVALDPSPIEISLESTQTSSEKGSAEAKDAQEHNALNSLSKKGAVVEFRWLVRTHSPRLTLPDKLQTSCDEKDILYAYRKPVLTAKHIDRASHKTFEWDGLGTQHSVEFTLSAEGRRRLRQSMRLTGQKVLGTFVNGQYFGARNLSKLSQLDDRPLSAGFSQSRAWARGVVRAITHSSK